MFWACCSTWTFGFGLVARLGLLDLGLLLDLDSFQVRLLLTLSSAQYQQTNHHPAIPYAEIGDFITALRGDDNISAKALEFLILTTQSLAVLAN